MKIDTLNKNEELPNIHDSAFYGFSYRENDKTLLVELSNHYMNKFFKIQFHNVLVLNCEMCQFWGKSPYVFDWNIDENEILIKNIMEKQKNNESKFWCSILRTPKEYIQINITFTSGDTIDIVCEFIEFEEREMNTI